MITESAAPVSVFTFDPKYYVEREEEDTVIGKVVEALQSNPVVILKGERGAGKRWFLLHLLAQGGLEEDQDKRQDKTQDKSVLDKWRKFIKNHQVFTLLCETIPVDREFRDTLRRQNVYMFLAPEKPEGARLREDDLRKWLAQEVREALGISPVVPLPTEEETQFQVGYRNTLQDLAAKGRAPFVIVDSMDVLAPAARELLLRLYLYPVLDVGGRLLLTMRTRSAPPFQRKAFAEAPEIHLPAWKDWRRWVQRWVARRLGRDEVQAPEQVWQALSDMTADSPLLLALAWQCAASSEGATAWEALQRQVLEEQEELRRCMALAWIHLTFAAYRTDAGFAVPLPHRETPFTFRAEEMCEILVSLCQAYVAGSEQNGGFDIWGWEPPGQVDRWDVMSLLNNQGLLTWQNGWTLDRTLRLLFCAPILCSPNTSEHQESPEVASAAA